MASTLSRLYRCSSRIKASFCPIYLYLFIKLYWFCGVKEEIKIFQIRLSGLKIAFLFGVTFLKVFLLLIVNLLFHYHLVPAFIWAAEPWREKEQVCVPESDLWELLLRGENTDGVLPLWVHFHPDRQAHLQPWRHWWDKRTTTLESVDFKNTQRSFSSVIHHHRFFYNYHFESLSTSFSLCTSSIPNLRVLSIL